MKLHIHDAMSSLRARLENREPQLLRGILNEAGMPGRLTFWVWDSKAGNDARRAIFPGYKNRPPSDQNTYTQLRMIRELLTHTPAIQAWHEGFEGDDIIAALVEKFRDSADILIHTRDGDLTALGVPTTAECKVPPRWVRLYKLTVGDKSDTIPGIPGFGQKTWDECDKPELEKMVEDRLAGRDWTPLACLQKRVTNWLGDDANVETLRAMQRVIAPLPMTPDQLENSLRVGKDNPAAREDIMRRFLL